MYRIGIDLGGTGIKVGIVDEENNIVSKASTPTRPERGSRAVAEDMVNTANNALVLAGISWQECSAIGIGSPGSCDSASGTVNTAHNLGWFNVPVCSMLTELTGLPAYLGNDADCAALGEATAGAAKGSGSALMITLGTGIGGGLIIDGKIFAGYKTLGGEAGHICIAVDGEECSCGERGCWEAYASASALVKQAEKMAAKHPESALGSLGKLNGVKIFAAADGGDETAEKVIAEYLRYVSVGLVSLINLLYPETVILGGGICGQGERILLPIRQYVEEHFFVKRRELMPRIVTAQLHNDAGIIGAANLCP